MIGNIRRLCALALLLAPVQAHPISHSPAAPKGADRFHASPGDGQHHSNVTPPYIKVYCDGVGSSNSGVDCPCGNELPPGATTGCANRTGHGASLIPTGVPSISNDTLVLTTTGMPLGVPGYYFAGAGTGGAAVFGNGIRCIVGPFTRLHKVAHSSGYDVFPAPGSPPISVQMNLSVGQQTFFQVVYRDFGGPCGGTVNATNAVMVVWGS